MTVLFVFLSLCGVIFSRMIVKQRKKASVATWRDWHQCVATVLSVIKPFSSCLKYLDGDETSWAVSRQSTEGEKCSEEESDKCQWLRFISELFFNNSGILCFFSLNLLLCSVYFMPVSDGDGSVEMAGNEEEKQGCGTEDAGWIWARGSSWLESFD